MSESMQFPGEALKQERMRQDLTEREVADKLHLSLNFLQAIEADDYERLPERTFIRGYIRNYARLLGLSGEELAATFDRINRPLDDTSESQTTTLPSDTEQHKKHRLIAIIIVVVLVVLAAIWQWADSNASVLNQQSTTDTPQHKDVSSSMPATSAANEIDPNMSADSAPTSLPTATSDASNTATTSTSAAKDAAPSTSAKLHIAFSASCWVEVTAANGQALFKGTKTAGEVIDLTGQAPFNVMFGNAGGVASVSVNGQSVDVSRYKAGQVETLQVP